MDLHNFVHWFMLMLRLILNGGKFEPDLVQLIDEMFLQINRSFPTIRHVVYEV